MRRLIHALIVRYLKSCWGSFHHGRYGPEGQYVVLMTDDGYHQYRNHTGIAVNINEEQLHELVGVFGGEPAEITLEWCAKGHAGPGLYAWHTEYEEEGSVLLGQVDSPDPATLSPSNQGAPGE